MEGVRASVSAGLSVIQGDADTDLAEYPDAAFDYVILSQTLQATRRPDHVLEHLVRIGRHAIVSVPNFGYWRLRLYLAVHGRMPRSRNLPYAWYDTPNIHLCTLKDFVSLCRQLEIVIERAVTVNGYGVPHRLGSNSTIANLFGENGVYLLARR